MRNIVLEENVVAEDEEGDGIILQQQYPWEGSDRDYDYEEVCLMFLLFFLPPLIYYIVCASCERAAPKQSVPYPPGEQSRACWRQA